MMWVAYYDKKDRGVWITNREYMQWFSGIYHPSGYLNGPSTFSPTVDDILVVPKGLV